MKTVDFIREVEKLGYDVDFCSDSGEIYISSIPMFKRVASVSSSNQFIVDTMMFTNKDVSEYLLNLVIEYSRTPIEEREDNNKYYIRHKSIVNLEKNEVLNYELRTKKWFNADRFEYFGFKTKFTRKELLELGYTLEQFEYREVGADNWISEEIGC